MTFHRYDPSRNPEDHEELALELPDDRPDPLPAPAAAGGRGPHDPTKAAPGVVFTEHGAVAVNKDQARIRKEAACPQCGYSIVGLKSTKCPECGVELLPALAAAARKAKARESIKHEYSVAGVALGIAVLALSVMVGLTDGWGAVPFELLGLAIITPLAFVAYLICCSLWIGFDMPLAITALRLAAIYAWSGFTLALFLTIFPYVPIVAWIFSIVVMFGLLTKWLDIDFIDAFGITFATNVVAFIVMMAMTHWG
ncbi:MAG: hypothetical protein KDA16_10000 [Phycisphaerales bacterium]|nr:hypothetical protein [Phycisphaerales bacterium]